MNQIVLLGGLAAGAAFVLSRARRHAKRDDAAYSREVVEGVLASTAGQGGFEYASPEQESLLYQLAAVQLLLDDPYCGELVANALGPHYVGRLPSIVVEVSHGNVPKYRGAVRVQAALGILALGPNAANTFPVDVAQSKALLGLVEHAVVAEPGAQQRQLLASGVATLDKTSVDAAERALCSALRVNGAH